MPARLIVLLDVVKLAADVGVLMAMVGGTVSAVYVIATTAVPWLPAASRAVTVTCVLPEGTASPAIAQLDVPVAVPLAPWSVDQVTWVIPALSDAVPLKLIVLFEVVKLGFRVGEVMVTVAPCAGVLVVP